MDLPRACCKIALSFHLHPGKTVEHHFRLRKRVPAYWRLRSASMNVTRKLSPHQQLVCLGCKDTEESSSTGSKSPFAPTFKFSVPNLDIYSLKHLLWSYFIENRPWRSGFSRFSTRRLHKQGGYINKEVTTRRLQLKLKMRGQEISFTWVLTSGFSPALQCALTKWTGSYT